MQVNDYRAAHSCRIFVLLVGVDTYSDEDIHDLSGCINDCKNFEAFLLENLGVPKRNIRSLHNEAATRGAILGAIDDHLFKNEEIVKGDVMIVFFAGHGSQVPAPECWTPQGSEVETIRPYDEGMQKDGTLVYGIPDRTIAILMAQLSRRKGDSIVTIFDCCFSGGLSRGTATVRSSVANDELASLPADLDQDIWDRDPDALHAILSNSTNSFLNSEVTSHVMLAACHETESAHETTKEGVRCGLFTHNLLKALRGHAIGAITYDQLIQKLPKLRRQSPQCVGVHKHRVLFKATERGTIIGGAGLSQLGEGSAGPSVWAGERKISPRVSAVAFPPSPVHYQPAVAGAFSNDAVFFSTLPPHRFLCVFHLVFCILWYAALYLLLAS
ncbi:hypothetical protein WOLCODRAFT_140997 [Wolfiporia cocos MD-104 SS10]|uniref:Peptidase C14 caspase domain-containing protein n=1 Tax=Wolfiporia cocos (strain MD-104) TaxID=742152 RepID=A0A2H3JGF1_WOLCO|nr:hypothetical protein WOLCODRAFT_140997 [Wolfiporia cocos MD-104 SS10]